MLTEQFYKNLEKLKAQNNQIIVATFYKFVQLNKIIEIKNDFNVYLKKLNIKGTILIANEGINGTIAGEEIDLKSFLKKISTHKEFKDISPKYSICKKNPFFRMKIRLKKEVVTIGNINVKPSDVVGDYVSPNDWNEFISQSKTFLIDTRNNYEISIGTFKNAINPNIKSFREFPNWVKENLIKKNISKNSQIGMFCTGGIRCEKSTSYLKKIGYKNVFHLEGGIIKYLDEIPEDKSLWEGECFVFDYRVSLKHGLKVGNYEMCFACRMPLSDIDKKDKNFVEGKSCKFCFDNTSEKQKQRFNERQKQILLSKTNHIGPKR